MIRKHYTIITALIMALSLPVKAQAQNTTFTYQGKLSVSGSPANGNYDFEFRLYDAVSGGSQIGSVQTRTNVAVSEGIFTITLDFGSQFPGADRFLDISVRQTGGGVYTLLAPRQPVSSSPYSIQTINSQMLGGLPASGFVQNTTTQQPSSSFNISGNGIIGGTLTVNGSFPNGSYITDGTVNLRSTIVGSNALVGTTTNHPLVLFSANGANNGSLRLDTTGNVGIDVIAPESKLTVHTFGSDYGLTHTNGSVRLTTFVGGNFNGGYLGTRSNHPLHFFTNDSGPLVTLTTAGNIGVGTTAPNAKFFVQGEAANGFGVATTGNASQSMNKGGWVKAMLEVSTTLPAGQQIIRCFNSQASGAAISTPPCGFTATGVTVGVWRIGFPFAVSTTFALVNASDPNFTPINTAHLDYGVPTSNELTIVFRYPNGDLTNPSRFTLVVF